MNGPVLECINLRPRIPVVEEGAGLTLQLGPDTITCLIGPGDSGKTSYLRLLAAVDPPAAGSLRILGQDTSTLDGPAWRRLRQRVGYVLPNSALLSSQSVLQNVALPAQYHYQRGRDMLDQAVDQAIALLQWLGYSADPDELPEYLPAYQQKLVAIARCLILNPQILFIDEAFTFMDAPSCREIATRYLAMRNERNITLILATSDLAFAKEHADRYIFTGPKGPKVYSDWVSACRDSDEAVQRFIHSNYDRYSTLSA